jgi:hypothetical protein
MKPVFEKMPINSGGVLSIIQTTDYLFIGAYQKEMYSGVHLDMEEAKRLRNMLNIYIEGVANNEQ